MLVSLNPAQFGRRFAAVAIALVFGLAHFGAGLHMALIEHTTCPHGELVHVGADRHGTETAAPALAQAAKVPHDARATIRTTLRADDDHEHCSVPQRHQEATVVSAHAQVAVARVPLARLVTTTTDPSADQRSVSVYRLAPKQSPPLAI